MKDFDITSLKTLALKVQYAPDELLDNAAREVAKYLQITGKCIDTLVGLVNNGPLFDGDVPSKEERDILMEVGLCVKVCVKGEDGFNAANQTAFYIFRAWEALKEEQKNDPEGASGTVGDTGNDDSGQELQSIANAQPTTESLVDDLQVEVIWDAIGTQYHQLGKEVIRVNTASILRYAELLTQTYCDATWVKTQDSSLGELEIKRVNYDAAMLQHHCWCLANLDVERVDDAVALQLITHARNLHDTLYDAVS